jgi:hypothetical protein
LCHQKRLARIEYLRNYFIGSPVVVSSVAPEERSRKTNESLINSWFPYHLCSIKFSDSRHDGVCMVAASIYEFSDALSSELTNRRVRREAA